MRYDEIHRSPEQALYDTLKRAAGPQFERVVIHPNKIRLAAVDGARDFMKSIQAKDIIEQAGWFISVLKDRTEKYGLAVDGSQKYRDFVEVRLENVRGQKAPEWMLLDKPKIYHVTTKNLVRPILRQGLIPKEPRRPDMHLYPPRIHFALTLAGADFMIGKFKTYDSHRNIEQEYVIFEVETAAAQPLFVDQEFNRDGVYTTEPVPPSAIKLLAP